MLRPDVVLFGEMLPLDKVQRLKEELATGFDCVFTVGTSSLHPYISGPVEAASRMKVPLGAVQGLDLTWSRYQEKVPV